jgi:tyrosine-protein kinase Etk/Wzc
MSERTNNYDKNSGFEHSACDEDKKIHLLDALIVLARYKKLVIGMPVAFGSIALAISLWLPPIFTSTVRIIPPQQQGGGLAAAMLGQLGGLAGAAGGIAGVKSPNDLYVSMLESRTVADRLIVRYKLRERFEAETADDALKELALATAIESGKKGGLISINVEDKDPKFAAELANAYVDELIKLNQALAVTEAAQRRVFFERQLKDAKEDLAQAEVALRQTQERTGLIQPDGQIQAIISSVANLRAAIVAKEVQIKAMRSFATAENPDIKRAQVELQSLRAELAKLERNQSTKEGDFIVGTAKLPEVGIEYVRKLRDVKYQETLFELLAKQYELAKIEEAKDASLIQVLDPAVPAERKTRPKRAIIVLGSIFLGAVLGILTAFAVHSYRRVRENPENLSRWASLSQVLRLSSS